MTSVFARRLVASCIIPAGAIIALAAPGGASAALGTQCSGANITGQGANVLKNAHTVWDAEFNLSKSKVACAGLKKQGNLAKPTVAYTTSSAAVGLESWGANKHATANFGIGNTGNLNTGFGNASDFSTGFGNAGVGDTGFANSGNFNTV